jgi:integrase
MASIKARKNSDGTTSYQVKIRVKGYRPKSATFDRLTDAKLWAQQSEADMRRGRHQATVASKKYTLADAIQRYRTEVMPHKAGCARSQPQQLDWWEETAGYHYLSDVTPDLISKIRNKLLAESRGARRKEHTPQKPLPKRSAATENRYLALLGHVFTIAVKEWSWVATNPVRNVRKLKEPPGRIRYLTDEERTKLLNVCRESKSPLLYLVVILALSTGMRKGEIMTLRWHQVDLEQQRITLYKTKNGDVRVVPLIGVAHELMSASAESTHDRNDMLFPGKLKDTPADIDTAWKNAVTAAGLTDFRFHDLRHSTASYLAMDGATSLEIGAVLGHRTLSMVKRYSHLGPSHVHNILSAMNEKRFNKVS